MSVIVGGHSNNIERNFIEEEIHDPFISCEARNERRKAAS